MLNRKLNQKFFRWRTAAWMGEWFRRIILPSLRSFHPFHVTLLQKRLLHFSSYLKRTVSLSYQMAANLKRDVFRKMFILVKLHLNRFKMRGKCCTHPATCPRYLVEKDLPPCPELIIWFIKGVFSHVENDLLKQGRKSCRCSRWWIHQWSSRVEIVVDYWDQEGWLVPQEQPSRWTHPRWPPQGHQKRVSRQIRGRFPARRRPLLITAGSVRFHATLGFDAICLHRCQFHHWRWNFPGTSSGYKRLLLCLLWGRRPVRRASQQLPLHS